MLFRSIASDLEQLRACLRAIEPGTVVRGRVLVSEPAVRACVAAGVEILVAKPRLPVLLAALQSAARGAPEDRKEDRS